MGVNFDMYLNFQRLLLHLLLVLFFSCNVNPKDSNQQYTLQVVDTLKVDFKGDVHASDFSHGTGVAYNFKKTEFIKFDSVGNVLYSNKIPTEGPQSISYANGLKILKNHEVLVHSLKGEIGLLDSTLQLKGKYQMPFSNYSMELRSNIRIMDGWKDQIYVYYPGRDSKSPLYKNYFRENYLLEKVDIHQQKSEPYLKLAPDSQYQKDLYFEQPSILVAIRENILYLALDNEPLIHLYDLENEGLWLETISIDPERFIQIKGQPLPLGNDGSVIKPALIKGIFPFENGIAVYYNEGLEKNTDSQDTDRQVIKIFQSATGWSNEMELPAPISVLLNFESPHTAFYALTENNTGSNRDNPLHLLKLTISLVP